MTNKLNNDAFNNDATKAETTQNGVRSQACIDCCGQSCFEVWLPVDAMDSFDEWLSEDLGKLEEQFASYITRNSLKGTSRR